MNLFRPFFLAAAVLTLSITACSRSPAAETATSLAPQRLPQGRAVDLAEHSSGVYAVGIIGISQDSEYFGTEAFVRKYDTAGNRVWSKRFGSLPNHSGATSTASDANDNLYVGGYTDAALPGSTGVGNSFLRKYTASGAVAWTRQSTHSTSGLATAGESLYAVGQMPDKNGGDAYLRRYDAAGNRVWSQRFGTSGRDYADEVVVSDTGYIYVTGYTSGTLAGSQGSGFLFLRKYTPSGVVKWTRQFNLGVPYLYDIDVAITGSDVYVMGSYISSTSDGKSAVYKVNTSGNVLWSRNYTLARGDLRANLGDLSADNTGVYLVGDAYFDDPNACYGHRVYLSKLSPSGSTLWEKRLALANEWSSGFTVLARKTNEVYVGGWADSYSCDDADYGNFYVGRASGTSGNTLWERY